MRGKFVGIPQGQTTVLFSQDISIPLNRDLTPICF